MFDRTTHKPVIVTNQEKGYLIIGSIDHGFPIPEPSMLEVITAMEGVSALMMETPEEFHSQFHPFSTELLVKAAAGKKPIDYLSGNKLTEDIGDHVLKYVLKELAEVYVVCMYRRNCMQEGQDFSFKSLVQFLCAYQQRFGFLDIQRTLENYMKLAQYWKQQGLEQHDLDHFSYDFEKFVGDIREFELWNPELTAFRKNHAGKIAVCCGAYHLPFIQSVLDGEEQLAPNWTTHIDTRREDPLTPQDPEFLKKIYEHITIALKL